MQHLVTTRDETTGEINIVKGKVTKETLEDLRQIMIDGANMFIDGLLESTKGHRISHGFMVHSLIHIIHDDEAENNPVYIKFLADEKRRERKLKLLKICQ